MASATPNPGPSPDASDGVVALAGIIGPVFDEPLADVFAVVDVARVADDRTSLSGDSDVRLALVAGDIGVVEVGDIDVGGYAVGVCADVTVVTGSRLSSWAPPSASVWSSWSTVAVIPDPVSASW